MSRTRTSRLGRLSNAAARIAAVVALWQAPVPWVHQHDGSRDASTVRVDRAPRDAARPASLVPAVSSEARSDREVGATRRSVSDRGRAPSLLAGHIARRHFHASRGGPSASDWLSATRLGWHVHFVFLSELREGENDSITPLDVNDGNACDVDFLGLPGLLDLENGNSVLGGLGSPSPSPHRVEFSPGLAAPDDPFRRRPRHLLESFSGRVTARRLLSVALC